MTTAQAARQLKSLAARRHVFVLASGNSLSNRHYAPSTARTNPRLAPEIPLGPYVPPQRPLLPVPHSKFTTTPALVLGDPPLHADVIVGIVTVVEPRKSPPDCIRQRRRPPAVGGQQPDRLRNAAGGGGGIEVR